MSINVTVKGNPVSIKRGKMVTSDPYNDKKEFEKRRLLRLEQVRQQSKELAEGVRNKVRREKKRQMGEIEREGKEKFKNWQNRKLLELQSQYMNALTEIGLGHKEAEKVVEEEEILEDQRLANEEAARNRGKVAATRLQIQKNEENFRKSLPLQHKKLVRDMENTRAAMVSSLNKCKPTHCQSKSKKSKSSDKHQASADINITLPNDSDFSEDSESIDHLPSIPEEQSEHSEGFCECTSCSEDQISESSSTDNQIPKKTDLMKNIRMAKITNENISNSEPFVKKQKEPVPELPVKEKSYRESIEAQRRVIEDFRHRNREVPRDTRISDRIKQREVIASQPDFCDSVAEPAHIPSVSESTKIRDKISSRPEFQESIHKVPFQVPLKDPLELSSEECMCSKFHRNCPCKGTSTLVSKSAAVQTDEAREYRKNSKIMKDNVREEKSKGVDKTVQGSQFSNPSSEIPPKPAVKLKSVNQRSKTDPLGTVTTATVTSGAYRVRQYDFPNRFESEVPSTSQVEKHTADSVEVIPNLTSEAEWHEKMKQRDREAQIRGQKAMEKEKIKRDYEDMMKKLPILQRKENIARIGMDKPEYHMSEERLQERERERQNRLENAFDKVIPGLRPRIVTIPSRKHEIIKDDEPFVILDGDDPRTLNRAHWDVETQPKQMFSAEEVQEIIKAFTEQKPDDRKAKLKELLKSLKLQKEQLLQEIKALPKDDSVRALISDLNSFNDKDRQDKHHSSSKKKKKDRKKESDRKRRREDSDTSNTSTDAAELGEKSESTGSQKQRKSPYKKARKGKAKVLVLQNMSTQTTPKVHRNKSSTNSSTEETKEESRKPAPQRGVKICTKSHVPCDCDKDDKENSEKLKNSEELCKIFIKLHDDERPDVEVISSARKTDDKNGGESGREKRSKSPSKQHKHFLEHSKKERTKSPSKKPQEFTQKVKSQILAKETQTSEVHKAPEYKVPKPLERPVKVSKQKSSTRKSLGRSKMESWKEHLSKNSISTTSTSYLSPPDFSRPNTTASTEDSKFSFSNLRKKLQQTNIDASSFLKMEDSTRDIDLRLFNYIKRLLSMSKLSVDNLGVSSSEVQTPSQSVIEMESNNPLAPLHNIIKFINLKAVDIAKELSESPGVSPVPPNSMANSSVEGSGSHVKEQESFQYLPEKDVPDKTIPDKQKESIMCKYADITDSCSKRIANLAAMIEKLRQEKIQMLQSPPISHKSGQESPAGLTSPNEELKSPDQIRDHLATPTFSDRDASTRYFEFPPSGEKSKGSNSTASMDEEELNRRLLEIDMVLAEKLKKFRQNKEDAPDDSQKSDCKAVCSQPLLEKADQDFLVRLQRLITENHEQQSSQEEPAVLQHAPETDSMPFVPMLDIPKLPILEPPEYMEPTDQTNSGKRHPPPSKGLTNVKKFNGNITLVPHELSTIVEIDSQLSTKVSPNTSKILTTPSKEIDIQVCPTLEEVSEKNLTSFEDTQADASKVEVVAPKSPTKSKRSIDNISDSPRKSDRSINTPRSPKKSGSFGKEASVVKGKPKDRSSKSPVKFREPLRSSKSPPSKAASVTQDSGSFKSLAHSDSSKSPSCNETTCTSLCLTGSSTKLSSSSSSSDMASIEAMLRSIGMDWAIPTLHKTQEALALSSSSSSGELESKKKKKSKSSGSSEVSLKDFLKKQMLSKISSSSLKSDGSPVSFLQEMSEISAIQASTSGERTKQRTSTPVLSSKSTNKSKDEQQPLFTGASDISSVRYNSCDNESCQKSSGKQPTFHTLANDEDSSATKSSVS